MAIPKLGLTSQADIMLKTYMKQNKKATCAQKEEILKMYDSCSIQEIRKIKIQ